MYMALKGLAHSNRQNLPLGLVPWPGMEMNSDALIRGVLLYLTSQLKQPNIRLRNLGFDFFEWPEMTIWKIVCAYVILR